MTPLTGLQFALLVAHIVLLVFNVIVFSETLRARNAKPMVIDKGMFKVVCPGDIAIIHFDADLSDQAHASFKAAFEGVDKPSDASVYVLEGCRSVLVVKLHEKSNASDDHANDPDDCAAVTREIPGCLTKSAP